MWERALEEGQLCVWAVHPEAVGERLGIQRLLVLLSPEERRRVERMRSTSAALSFMVGRLLLRSGLSQTLGWPPWKCGVRALPSGRLELTTSPHHGLKFSISHAAGLVVCAFGIVQRLGVDVEDLLRPVDTHATVVRFFPSEAERLLRGNPQEQRERFFEHWVRFESYAKATGEGMDLLLRASPSLPRLGTQNSKALAWQISTLKPTSRHLMATAALTNGKPDLELVSAERALEAILATADV